MNSADLRDMIVERALRILNWDDANPDVGMGMFTSMAVDKAIKGVIKDGKRFGTTVSVPDAIREAAISRVKAKRDRQR